MNQTPKQISRFLTTQWSKIVHASLGDHSSKEALNDLCQVYWYPLYAFARRRGLSECDAEDQVQDFLFRFMSPKTLVSVDQTQGKFRTYLLSSFVNHVKNFWRAQSREKRGGLHNFLELNQCREEDYAAQLSHLETPEKAFERAWAMICLERALCRLERDYQSRGQLELFQALQAGLTRAASEQIQSWSKQFEKRPGAIRAALHRMRQDYRQALRQEIAETVASEAAVDEEVQLFFSTFSS